MDSKKYIGMDVHQATISVPGMDAAGKLVMESIIENKSLDDPGVPARAARELDSDV
jgi:hypothetical protein